MSERLVDLEAGGEAAEMVLAQPPRWLRGSVYLFSGMIFAALLWAYTSKVDIVISAPGSVRPLGDLVKVQSLAAGSILQVLAKEGDSVKAGDILFRIDGKESQKEMEKLQGRRDTADRQLASLRLSREGMLAQHLAERSRDEIAVQSAQGELEKSKGSLAQAQAAWAESLTRVADAEMDFERTRRLVEEKVLSHAELQKKENAWKGALAFSQSAEAAKRVAQQEVSLREQGLLLQRKQSDIAAEERKRALSDLDSRLVALEEEERGLDLEVQKWAVTLGHLDVRAPQSGAVTAVAMKNAGEVVRPGDVMASIAPEGARWIVEALVSNRDAGPLRQKIGGRVKLKFDAFPFRDYGAAEGELIEVSQDAIAHERLGSVFRVYIEPKSLELKRGRRQGQIGLGMTVTAEIVKEEERILALLYREVRDRVSYD